MAVIYLPSQVALLLEAERQKGGLLTRQEVESLHEGAILVSVPDGIARYMEPAYSYPAFGPLLRRELRPHLRLEVLGQPGAGNG